MQACGGVTVGVPIGVEDGPRQKSADAAPQGVPATRQKARPMKPDPKPIIGERRGGEPQDEREHFIKCPVCGRWIDMRDLGEVLDHEWTCEGRGTA